MSVFIRRFSDDPGNTVLLEIESVNILDRTPPASIQGAGTGTALLVGEFEDGPFNDVTEVTSATDLISTFGSLGYTYAGVPGNNASAVLRHADSPLASENWNGNGFVQLNGKKFSRLLICRVDTSTGTVLLTADPFVVGNSQLNFTLVPGQDLVIDDGTGPATATFTVAAATVTGVAGTFPTLFVGGETLTLGFDNSPNFTTTFTAADQSAAQVAARINAFAGFTFADTSGGQLRLTGIQQGTGGQVRVVSGSTGVIATLGLTVANTPGTGNVANIASVTVAEANSVVNAAHASCHVVTRADGRIMLFTTGVSLTVAVASTATAFGFPFSATPVTAGSTGTIPAGTVVQNVAATRVYVTMQDVATLASNAGPYRVKVRPALDNDTDLGTGVATVTVLPAQPAFGAFSVTNDAAVSAALTEAAIDAAYVTAVGATLDLNTVAREANIIWSARQSNAVRRTLKQNAIDASAIGMLGRMACIRPPLGTTRAVAEGGAEPGVGAYRDQRTIYCYPGASTLVPVIAQRGTAGGVGFTADGLVDVGADGFMASDLSQLPPEENPGQLTAFLGGVVSLESSPSAAGFTIVDYTNFRSQGIAALRIDDGTPIFQSGVTSVNPSVFPQLRNIARRRMADFIQDSVARASKAFGKKLNTFQRRKALTAEIRQFLQGLVSVNNPSSQRIDSFSLDENSGNTPETIAAGIFRLIIKVRTLSSLDSIVLDTTIGETVTVDEQPLAA